MKKHSLPDWATVHKELRNKCVTLQLLWEEYDERNPDGFYSYNHYCRLYRDWLKTTSPSMRQVHKAGEKLFVDYCGPTVDITHPDTGEIRTAQIFRRRSRRFKLHMGRSDLVSATRRLGYESCSLFPVAWGCS